MKNKLQKKNKGVTLIELTVVILVLLSLIAVLFIGARAYKEASDRTACLLTVRNVQQAGRSWQNLNGHTEGTSIVWDEIVGEEGFLNDVPACRSGASTNWEDTYTQAPDVPDTGTLFIVCNVDDVDHEPENTGGW